MPPINPFADLLESSTASATPSDDVADDLEQVVLQSAAAANNPFLAALGRDVNGAVAVDTSDPWSSHAAAAGLLSDLLITHCVRSRCTRKMINGVCDCVCLSRGLCVY